MEEKMDKGFTVQDKRMFTSDGEQKKEPSDCKCENKSEDKKQDCTEHTSETKKDPQAQETSSSLPEPNFASFIISLSSSALFHFGEIPDPVTNKKQRNLPMAKQTVDILGMLENKTQGNRTKDEEALLKNLLHDLRIRYVTEVEKERKE